MTELATRDTSSMALTDAPFTYKTLQAVVGTEFVPKGLRGNVAATLACILYGREIGLQPMQALSQIHVIDGKPTPSAELLGARVRNAGHRMRAVELDDLKAVVIGERVVDGEVVESMSFTFTMEMAKRAGLAGKDNWKRYPEAMLYWRATSQLARMFFPDLLIGFYTPEELGSEDWHMEPSPMSDEFIVDADDDTVVEAEIVDDESEV